MKKLILSLFVGIIGFISFGYCEDIISRVTSYVSFDNLYSGNCSGYCCIQCSSSSRQLIRLNFGGNEYDPFNGNYSPNDLYCFELSGSYTLTNLNSTSVTVNNYNIPLSDCPTCSTCEDPYTSVQCQYIYNLIPVEDIDINYCVGNGYCPNECGSGDNFSGDLQFSNIFINNILHPGRENIFIDIPDYIYWDYSIDTGNFNVYVGSGYDQDYIDGVLSINTYKPSSEDFTQVFVSGLTLIFPYIFVALFIIFVWKLLKRVFK